MAARRGVPEPERQWLRVLGTLNELQARVFVAQKALEEGRGGISRLSQLTGMSRPTIMKGIAQLQGKGPLDAGDTGGIRRAGAGRKRVEEGNPEFTQDLVSILEEATAGDPMTHLKWTNKSVRMLAEELGNGTCQAF